MNDERMRLFPDPEPELDPNDPDWASKLKLRHAFVLKKINELQSDLDKFQAEADKLAPIMDMLRAPTIEHPAVQKAMPAPRVRKKPTTEKAKKVFLHPIHKPWKPREVMHIFDTMQRATTAEQIEEALRGLGREFNVSMRAIEHQWLKEKDRRGLR